MIVSHRHRYIFLHSRKTAGSSIAVSLARYLDPDDLFITSTGIFAGALRSGFVPPPATRDEVRRAVIARHGEAFAAKAYETPDALRRKGRKWFGEIYHGFRPGSDQRWDHIGAADARAFLGPEVWDSYFKFAFERNPWDRVASLYWWRWRKAERPGVSFHDFVRAIHSGAVEQKKAARAHEASNWYNYTIGDTPAVDYIGRLETLADDMHSITERIGLPFDGWIPNYKSKTRAKRSITLAELYDDRTAAMVGEAFHREIALFGYRRPF